MDMNLGDTQLILEECRKNGCTVPQTAYILATARWETAHTMKPVMEAFWLSDAWRRKNLRYHPWHGRGYVQLTWEDNYKRAGGILGRDLTTNPDVVMQPDIAAEILVRGSMDGWFTKHKLTDHVNAERKDYVNARRVINGTDKAAQIAQIAMDYEAALMSGDAGDNIFRDDFMPESNVPTPARLPVQQELPVLQLGSKEKEMVRALQVRLTELRYFLGNTKGDFGPRTEAAVIAFQTDNGLVRDGKVGRQTRAALEIAVPRALRDVSKEEVAAESRTIKEAEKGKQRIAVAGVLAGLPTAVSQIEEITEVINQARSLTDLMSGLAPMTLAILGIGAAVFFGFRAFNKIEGYRIEDAQTGANDRI